MYRHPGHQGTSMPPLRHRLDLGNYRHSRNRRHQGKFVALGHDGTLDPLDTQEHRLQRCPLQFSIFVEIAMEYHYYAK